MMMLQRSQVLRQDRQGPFQVGGRGRLWAPRMGPGQADAGPQSSGGRCFCPAARFPIGLSVRQHRSLAMTCEDRQRSLGLRTRCCTVPWPPCPHMSSPAQPGARCEGGISAPSRGSVIPWVSCPYERGQPRAGALMQVGSSCMGFPWR